ncbi:hypothetical protein C4K88_01670 [Arthrobacter pityocampae]|uniref:PhnB-like domain-containing protein n=1 Tax=Arthrobacter pityocampae TaxID=547334 RepID=A0A2S5J1B9_9MICC|nr:VOC family protein [Arthrobacter pityocampae]PPB50619.1 hypothetical protein C4K88_01670 [Arthrobacter pityocampae]
MAAMINSYLSFRDTAREAMAFYQSVFGGDLATSTFAEFQLSEDPAEQDKIMHSQLTTPTGQVLMASDTPNAEEYVAPAGHSLSISGDDEPELRGYWDALAGSGRETMPLAKAPWGDWFGMCVDRFGISWMVSIAAAPGGPRGEAASAPVDTAGAATGV